VLTLTVHHREATYAYPVVAGQSFEVGASTVTVIGPPPTPPGPEEEEEPETSESPPAPNSNPKNQPLWYLHAQKLSTWTEAAPRVNLGNGEVEKEWSVRDCGSDEANDCKYWEVVLHGDYLKSIVGKINALNSGLGCEMHLKTGFDNIRYVPNGAFPPSNPEGWLPPLGVPPNNGEHLLAYCHYDLESWPVKVGEFEVGARKECKAVQAWIWPNGWVQKYHRKWNPGSEPNRLWCAPVSAE
jgi:hypothetical protein